MKTWADIGFEIEITADGSPSLRLLESADPAKFRGESMHHSGGAASETLLIYGEPFKELLRLSGEPRRVLIVGLGLGYIEMTLARECMLSKQPQAMDKIYSYESVPELREFFLAWIRKEASKLHPEVLSTYEQVAAHLTTGTNLTIQNIQDFLAAQFSELNPLQGALPEPETLPEDIHGIFYDAFSSKTTPHLWEEDFLCRFLQKTAAETCLFTTYACRASLKRALNANGFSLQVRPGFQGKRNSTLAWKGNSL